MNSIKKFIKQTPVFPVLKFGRRVIRKIRTETNRVWTLKIEFPHLYKKYAKQPVDEHKVLFLEVRLPELSGNFALIKEAFEELGGYDIHLHTLHHTVVKRKEYDQNCRKMFQDLATAKYVFVDEASHALSCVPMRPETVVVQTWHGCGAFKKFGFSTADLLFGFTKKQLLRFPLYENYTFVTVSSPEVIWAYAEAMNLMDRKELIKPIGLSRTDVFFKPDYMERAKQRLWEKMPESKGKKVILYAPTFRGRVHHAKAPDQLDIPMFQKMLGDEYVLVIKQHQLVHEKNIPPVPDECKGFAIDVTYSMKIEDLLMVSDICISDYSSLIFEYSLFERPMLFFAYDKHEYDDWRGFYYDYNEMTPGPVCMTNEEMIDYIQNLDTRFDKQQVIDFKNKFMRSCDGHATERIMALAMEK